MSETSRPLINRLRHKMQLGWVGQFDTFNERMANDRDGRPHVLKPGFTHDALAQFVQRYEGDAHFVVYYARDTDGQVRPIPRSRKTSLSDYAKEGLTLWADVIVYDVDCKEVHGTPVPAPASWFDAEIDKIVALPDGYTRSMLAYNTRGGYRLVFKLPEPLPIERYEATLLAFHRVLGKHGIAADPACKDWTRLFRLPRVGREDIDDVGNLIVKPSEPSLFFMLDATDLTPLSIADTRNLEWPAIDWTPPAVAEPAERGDVRSGRQATGGIFKGLKNAGAFQLHERITENRNVMLARLAGVLRQKGMDAETIRMVLLTTNAEKCDPPLDDSEVTTIARSIGSYPTNADFGAAIERAFGPAAEHPTKRQKPASVLVPTGDTEVETDVLASPENAPEGQNGKPKRQAKQIVPNGQGPQPAAAADAKFKLGSDTEVAEVMLEDLEDGGPRHVFDRNKMWRYSAKTGVWSPALPAVYYRHTASYDGAWVHKGVDSATGEDKWTVLRVGDHFVQNVYNMATYFRESPEFFVGARDGLCFTNGFVSVSKAGEITVEPFNPEHRVTAAQPYAHNRGQVPKLFLKLLDDLFAQDPDKAGVIATVQEFLGAALIGKATRFQKAMVFVGEGSNGKSTLLDILQACFETKSVTSVAPQQMSNEYRRAKLSMARLNVVSEMPEADILASETVKAMITGDLMDGRAIREAAFDFRPIAAQLWSANTLPAVRDVSHGFWRRFLVVYFRRIFTEQEQDRELPAKIIGSELSQIVAWGLDGAARLCGRGCYAAPASMTEALKAWQDGADQVRLFVDETCEVTSEVTTDSPSATFVYAVYRGWTERTGHKPMTLTKFGVRLKAIQVPFTRVDKGVRYGLSFPKATVA